LRILLVHNFYGSSAPSGENKVFSSEKSLLELHGHSVEVFMRSSDEIRDKGVLGYIKGGLATPWNFLSRVRFLKAIKKFQPDLIHVHNTFPLISPSILYGVDKKIPIVMTLHNYRIFCAAGVPMRNGNTCVRCLDRHSPISALIYGCYRNSRLATIPLVINIGLHQFLGTWVKKIDSFIAFTYFQKHLIVNAGLPHEKIFIKPNSCSDLYQNHIDQDRLPVVIYVGRLSLEKGLITLIEAWRKWSECGQIPPNLKIIGEGPLKLQLQALSHGLPIQFMGQLDQSGVQNEIANAQLLVLPSECYEGFPMVVVEALSLGTPVAASNLGSLPEIVRDGVNGLIFEPKNSSSLFNALRRILEDPIKLKNLQLGARLSYENNYTSEENYQILLKIYQNTIKNKLNI